MEKTIYDHLMQCKERMTLACFKVNIDKKLCLLFKQISGIDLSSQHYPFLRAGGSLNFGVSIRYDFKYGSMTVKTQFAKLIVTLYFKDEYKDIFNFPSQSNNCTIDVDHNLNFIQATFEDSLPLSKKHLNKNLFINHFYIKINHIFTLDGYEKKLSSQDGLNGEIVNLHRNLDIRFRNKDYNFDDLFVKFIKLLNCSPTIFYIGFPNYPNYRDLITKSRATIAFVNMFVHDYFNDINNLNEIIANYYLLSDMADI